jgi:hypothetical protein
MPQSMRTPEAFERMVVVDHLLAHPAYRGGAKGGLDAVARVTQNAGGFSPDLHREGLLGMDRAGLATMHMALHQEPVGHSHDGGFDFYLTPINTPKKARSAQPQPQPQPSTEVTPFGLAANVRNTHDGKTYFVSTARKYPLPIWETAVFRGSAASAKTCLYVQETYLPGGNALDTLTRRRARDRARRQSKVNHTAVCDIVAKRSVEDWRMEPSTIKEIQRVAAEAV